MSNEVLIAMITGLVAIVSGVGGALLGAKIAANAQKDAAFLRTASEAASLDFQEMNSQMRWRHERGASVADIMPYPAYLYFHAEMLKLLDSGDLTQEAILALRKDTRRLSDRLNTEEPEA